LKKVFPDLPGWSFNVIEVSNGVYEVTAEDYAGHRLSETGTDPYKIIDKMKEEAKQLI
jgi:hypothetical protein